MSSVSSGELVRQCKQKVLELCWVHVSRLPTEQVNADNTDFDPRTTITRIPLHCTHQRTIALDPNRTSEEISLRPMRYGWRVPTSMSISTSRSAHHESPFRSLSSRTLRCPTRIIIYHDKGRFSVKVQCSEYNFGFFRNLCHYAAVSRRSLQINTSRTSLT